VALVATIDNVDDMSDMAAAVSIGCSLGCKIWLLLYRSAVALVATLIGLGLIGQHYPWLQIVLG
jgi:hypothetical protein